MGKSSRMKNIHRAEIAILMDEDERIAYLGGFKEETQLRILKAYRAIQNALLYFEPSKKREASVRIEARSMVPFESEPTLKRIDRKLDEVGHSETQDVRSFGVQRTDDSDSIKHEGKPPSE